MWFINHDFTKKQYCAAQHALKSYKKQEELFLMYSIHFAFPLCARSHRGIIKYAIYLFVSTTIVKIEPKLFVAWDYTLRLYYIHARANFIQISYHNNDG